MSALADLEDMLRARPGDVEALAVYADALMGEGDPRGEQIAIELRDPARRPLLLRWLASHLKREPGGDHLHVVDEQSIPFLASPMGDFCRGVAARVRIENARLIVDALAQRPRPFLTYFRLYAGFDGPLALDERHVAAMPNVVELDLDGDFDLRAFRHPGVVKLRRASWSMNGLRSWAWPLDLPSCRQLAVDFKPWSTNVDPATVTFAGLPALRALDVSECEPMYVRAKDPGRTNMDVFRWLAGLPLLRQLRSLRVPSVRTPENARQLAQIVARASGATIEVARTYSRCAAGLELASDRVRFAAPWPWLPDSEEHDHWSYRLTGPRGIAIDMLSGAIGAGLERVFDRGDEAFRDDWRTIWRALDTCTPWSPKALPFGLVLRSFEGFPREDIGSATQLRKEILALRGQIGPEELVNVAPRS
jgi:uncharacterized protein (TIGR02996 family)